MAFNFRLFFRLTYYAIFRAKNTHGRLTPYRARALFFWYLLIPAYNLITWFCFLLDDLLFPAYRKQEVKSPIFIIGNFRSGSTLIQRLLARDEKNLTSMKMWEIYIAPSIVQRKILQAVGRFDAGVLGGRLHRLVDHYDAKRFRSIPMHHVSLWEPDEDEGIMMHNWTSSFLIFIFPFLDALPSYFYFDERLSEKDQRLSMEFYRRMLQKHVYFHGGKRYVAKNPAFSVKIETLRRYFPDAKFIYLVRNPVDMLASKTSFFSYIWRYFGEPRERFPFRDFILDFTRYWYTYPLDVLSRLSSSEYLILKYDALLKQLEQSVLKIYDHFNIPFGEPFYQVLKQEVARAEHFVSTHHYSLSEMGYSPNQVYTRYEEIFSRFNFKLDGKALVAQVSKHEAVID